jgi:hypothetical protein
MSPARSLNRQKTLAAVNRQRIIRANQMSRTLRDFRCDIRRIFHESDHLCVFDVQSLFTRRVEVLPIRAVLGDPFRPAPGVRLIDVPSAPNRAPAPATRPDLTAPAQNLTATSEAVEKDAATSLSVAVEQEKGKEEDAATSPSVAVEDEKGKEEDAATSPSVAVEDKEGKEEGAATSPSVAIEAVAEDAATSLSAAVEQEKGKEEDAATSRSTGNVYGEEDE